MVELGALPVGEPCTSDFYGVLDCFLNVQSCLFAFIGQDNRYAVFSAVGVSIAYKALACEFLDGSAYGCLIDIAQPTQL